MNITMRTTLFVITAALLTILAAFLFTDPASAATRTQLPGENLSVPVVDNPAITNNGEGRDPADIEELREHWRKPEYLVDQHRQILGIAVFCGSVAGYGIIARKHRVLKLSR